LTTTKHECPYCLTVVPDDNSVVCPTCGKAHHTECWSENGGCSAKNCPDVRRVIEVEVEDSALPKLEISKESAEGAIPATRKPAINPCIKCGKTTRTGELYCPVCEPAPEESRDVANLGPLLLMLLLLGLALAWLLIVLAGPSVPDRFDQPPKAVDTAK